MSDVSQSGHLLVLLLVKLQKGLHRQREDTGLSFELCLFTVFSKTLVGHLGLAQGEKPGQWHRLSAGHLLRALSPCSAGKVSLINLK